MMSDWLARVPGIRTWIALRRANEKYARLATTMRAAKQTIIRIKTELLAEQAVTAQLAPAHRSVRPPRSAWRKFSTRLAVDT